MGGGGEWSVGMGSESTVNSDKNNDGFVSSAKQTKHLTQNKNNRKVNNNKQPPHLSPPPLLPPPPTRQSSPSVGAGPDVGREFGPVSRQNRQESGPGAWRTGSLWAGTRAGEEVPEREAVVTA